MERDPKGFSDLVCFTISTHTLTWSVTIDKIVARCGVFISTHTLTWSVTRLFFLRSMPFLISTHTLTWSVTYREGSFFSHPLHFNSHAHVERDRNLYMR